MIILRQEVEGAKYKMTDRNFLATKLIPYWLFPLPDQELKPSNSCTAGGCAGVWEWEQLCFAKSFFFMICFETTISGHTPGEMGGDCLTGKACLDGDDSGHTQIQKPSTRGMVLEKF